MDWQTFGHENVKNILNKQISTAKFPQAYLFSGSERIGKKTLAFEFAKKVMAAEKLDNHPDFQILDLGNAEITVEAILNFISGLKFKPFVAQKKVAVINNAENLNVQSSNALLKTLEEPSASTIIILIAGSGRLLPTIVSRCQKFNFNIFTESQLQEFAKINSISVTQDLIALSFGQIGRLKEFSENKERLNKEEQKVKEFQSISKMPIGGKLASIGIYAEKEAEELQNNLLLWLNWQAGQLNNNPKSYGKLQALSDAFLGLKMNKNKKLLLQSLFLKI